MASGTEELRKPFGIDRGELTNTMGSRSEVICNARQHRYTHNNSLAEGMVVPKAHQTYSIVTYLNLDVGQVVEEQSQVCLLHVPFQHTR